MGENGNSSKFYGNRPTKKPNDQNLPWVLTVRGSCETLDQLATVSSSLE